ncbi:TetR/AcrR family transcriptional regulator [Psychromicrobium silvestre]|nr:TetR-like C-terminal domain-containing protein [Psychromicrobium silvestre]
MPRAGLNRAAVTQAALKAVDGGGSSGFTDLTLASIASAAGVAVPSLYKHVESLADLKRLVALASVAELTDRMSAATIGRAGPECLAAMAQAVRAFAKEHPGRYAASQQAANPNDPADQELAESGVRAVELIGGVLRGFELPDALSIDAIRMIRSALHGFIVLELGGGFGLPDDLDKSFSLLVHSVTSGVQQLAELQ